KHHQAKGPLANPTSVNEAEGSEKAAANRKKAMVRPGKIRANRGEHQPPLESLLAVEDAVGQIVNELTRTGKLNDTYIIFTSDNGFFHGEHRVQAGKVLLYEPSVRVPLLRRGPGVPAGRHRSQFVANTALPPTIAQAPGAHP